MNRSIIGCLLFFLLFFACQPKGPDYASQKSIISDSASVVAAHPLATEAGLKVLQQGGNAVDAAVAVQFALAVTVPRAGNIGGGGFMVASHESEYYALDFREKAPARAFRDMYLDEEGNPIPEKSLEGWLAVGVPGSVAGLWAAHQKLGSLPWSTLLEQAIRLAESGFMITEAEARGLTQRQEVFEKWHPKTSPFLKPNWEAGDRLVQKQLAQTLKEIQSNGRDGFYQGAVAESFAAEMEANGGWITREDLSTYEPVWRAPLVHDYQGYTLIAMPPPSSGGIAVMQMLEMLEPYDVKEMGFHSSASIHLIAEVMQRAFADRARYLGDPDFFPVPMEQLKDSAYLAQHMVNYSPDEHTPSEQIQDRIALVSESLETTHTSIVDAQGNAVSLTTTLNSSYGSKVWVSGGGFLLNNEMDDFSVKPGVPNQFGLVGTEANSVQPGKRMLSSMTPTIVEKEGEVFLVAGAPGGPRIITGTFQVILNVLEFGLPLDSALNAPRFHHQWLPDLLVLEDGFSPAVLDSLSTKGHELKTIGGIARVKAIHRKENGQWIGVGDPRSPDDDVAGY